MARKELVLQSNIVKSVRDQGGHARRWVDKFQVGMPDTIICLPPFVPAICEVKDLGDVGATFSRLIGITPKQQEELRRWDVPYSDYQSVYAYGRHSAFILVGWTNEGQHYLTALGRTQDRLAWDGSGTFVKRETGGKYPGLRRLLGTVGIAEIKLL